MGDNKQGGFTLIEILVVIGIIGILVAIAIPGYQGIKDKSYNAASEADLTNIRKATETFYLNNDHYPDSIAPASGKIVLQTAGAEPVPIFLTNKVYFGMKSSAESYAMATKHLQGSQVLSLTSTKTNLKETAAKKGAPLVASDIPNIP